MNRYKFETPNPKSETNSNNQNSNVLNIEKLKFRYCFVFRYSYFEFNPRRGQSLFEVVFALGIAAVILVAMAGLSTTTLRNSAFSKDSASATQFAAEATEWLRSQRDNDWAAFVSRANPVGRTWCISNLSWPSSAGACGPQIANTSYSRSVILRSRDVDGNSVTDTVDAEIVVSWIDAQGTHDIKNQTSFTDWRR